MASTIQIIRARQFIRATPEGVIDFEQSKNLLAEFASVAQGLDQYEILIDLQRAIPQLNTPELWYLVEEPSNLGVTHRRKTAVLCLREQFADVAFWALSAQNRGFPISAFNSFELAIEWLIQDNSWQQVTRANVFAAQKHVRRAFGPAVEQSAPVRPETTRAALLFPTA